jgi:translation initiation factor IF-1
MNPYAFSLYLGASGLVVMAFGGFISAGHGGPHAHGGHQGGHVGGHHGSHDVGDVSLGAHSHGSMLGHGGHGAHGGHVGHTHAGHANGHHAHEPGDAGRALVGLLSPRVLFSVLVGVGATGLLLSPWLGGLFLLLAALAGGALFEAAIVAPLWRFLFRFASNPALSLESVLMDTAEATSGFDASGCGLVAVELDGRLVQLLGTLRPEDRSAGIRVRAGDRVRIEDVDADRNRCTVSYLGR